MANTMTRVMLSVPNLTGAIAEKGSRWCVTESKATARVESSILIRIGDPDCAVTFSNLKSKARIKNAHADNKIIERKLGVAGTNIAEKNCRMTLEVEQQCITNFEGPID